MTLPGKVALITGAAVRVGRAIALELAGGGCDIGLHYRNSRPDAEGTAAEIRRLGRRVVLLEGDLSDRSCPQRIVDEVSGAYGRLDVLVNSASTFEKHLLADTDEDVWNETLSVNLMAPALLARAAAPHMLRAGGGRIINMADILAERPPKGFAAYCTSKAALIGLTRCLAIELAPTITVNAIAPGIAEFPEDYDEATKQKLIDHVPLKRAGSPEEVAALARWLIESGEYVTGQIIRIDGGRSIRT